jgi:hypothetical protein
MANIFPGAIWKPMPNQASRPKRRKGRGVGYHIAVYEGSSIYNINLGTGNDAHLYVRRDGTAEQNVDLDLQAWAGADGNGSMIWVETQGGTTAADVKSGQWTGPQFETLARIAAWAHNTEGVPLQVMPDSRSTSRGLATHRLGIQHSLGIGAVPGWLISGGERWSKVIGKECPGDARVGQVPSLVTRAQQIANGDTDVLTDDDIVKLWYGPRFRDNMNYAQVIQQMQDAINAVARQTQALDLAGRPGAATDDQYGHILSLRAEVEALSAKVDALAKGSAPVSGGTVAVGSLSDADVARIADAWPRSSPVGRSRDRPVPR